MRPRMSFPLKEPLGRTLAKGFKPQTIARIPGCLSTPSLYRRETIGNGSCYHKITMDFVVIMLPLPTIRNLQLVKDRNRH